MTKITHNGLWLDYSSMQKEDKKNYLISCIFLLIAGAIGGFVTTANSYGNLIPATEMTIAGIICLLIGVFFWLKFYRTQDEMFKKFHNFSVTTGAYCFIVLGIILPATGWWFSFFALSAVWNLIAGGFSK